MLFATKSLLIVVCYYVVGTLPTANAFSVVPRKSTLSQANLFNNLRTLQAVPLPPSSQQQQSRSSPTRTDYDEDGELFSAETRQLLGLGHHPAAQTQLWKIRLQLAKSVSWVPLSFIVMCGAAVSGNYHAPWNSQDMELILQDALLALGTMILAGPFSEGFAQTINDWYDRDIDAINEPHRPIPSGTISEKQVKEQLAFLFVGGLGLAYMLDQFTASSLPVLTVFALFGYLCSYIYSAPPMKLKQNGWLGGLAICLCYIALPWLCGHAVFGSLEQPADILL